MVGAALQDRRPRPPRRWWSRAGPSSRLVDGQQEARRRARCRSRSLDHASSYFEDEHDDVDERRRSISIFARWLPSRMSSAISGWRPSRRADVGDLLGRRGRSGRSRRRAGPPDAAATTPAVDASCLWAVDRGAVVAVERRRLRERPWLVGGVVASRRARRRCDAPADRDRRDRPRRSTCAAAARARQSAIGAGSSRPSTSSARRRRVVDPLRDRRLRRCAIRAGPRARAPAGSPRSVTAAATTKRPTMIDAASPAAHVSSASTTRPSLQRPVAQVGPG